MRLFAVATASVLLMSSVVWAEEYRVTQIVDPNGRWVLDGGHLAEDGTVTGWALGAPGSFIWTEGSVEMVDGFYLGRKNRHGTYAAHDLSTRRAGTYRAGTFTPIGPIDSYARSIDDDGWIGGFAANYGGESGRGFFGSLDSIEYLPSISHYVSIVDFADRDNALVWVGTESGSIRRWNRATGYSWMGMQAAREMNRLGHVLGTDSGWNIRHFDGEQTVDLGHGRGLSLNDHGDLLVDVIRDEMDVGPGIGRLDSEFVLLQDLLVDSAGWEMTSALRINNARQILAKGQLNGGQEVLVRLDPVPEPSTLVALGLGALLFMSRRAKT